MARELHVGHVRVPEDAAPDRNVAGVDCHRPRTKHVDFGIVRFEVLEAADALARCGDVEAVPSERHASVESDCVVVTPLLETFA